VIDMPHKTRTDYRKQRRTLLKEIFNKLWLIQSFNDTQLEKTKILFFQNLDMDLDDIIHKKEHDGLYFPNNKVFIEKDKICKNVKMTKPKIPISEN
jgi:hypothetical protein